MFGKIEFCRLDFDKNINDRNFGQLLVDYPRQSPGCKL